MRTTRLAVFCWALALQGFSYAEETYIGLFLQGKRIGYSSSATTEVTLGGRAVRRSDSTTLMDLGLLGTALKVAIASSTWSDAEGKPMLLKYRMESAGRVQLLEANFTSVEILVSVDNSGTKSSKRIALPKEGKVVDDAVNALLALGAPLGAARSFYVLDPMTVTLVKNTATLTGKSMITLNGREVEANTVEVVEPRATMKVYFGAKGNFLKAIGPMGIEMLPLSKEVALAEIEGGGAKPDLAELSRIVPDRPLGTTAELAYVRIRVSGAGIAAAPSDAHQRTQKDVNGWIVEIHPVVPNPERAPTIESAFKAMPQWTKPGLNIPSAADRFKRLSKEIVGKSTKVIEAASKIRRFVTASMRANAGIGVLRDATEVLATKEGVCRDYAILTATLLRAAKIPARLCSGLVYQDGAYYYHAWTEAFDGASWVGFDSTRPDGVVGAGHVKLAQGSVEEAFMFTFLDRASVQVLETRRRMAGSSR